MQLVSLVTLDCTDGLVRRYARIAGNKARETGRFLIDDWKLLNRGMAAAPDSWSEFVTWIQEWRLAWTPPEDPSPRPTSPHRSPTKDAA